MAFLILGRDIREEGRRNLNTRRRHLTTYVVMCCQMSPRNRGVEESSGSENPVILHPEILEAVNKTTYLTSLGNLTLPNKKFWDTLLALKKKYSALNLGKQLVVADLYLAENQDNYGFIKSDAGDPAKGARKFFGSWCRRSLTPYKPKETNDTPKTTTPKP